MSELSREQRIRRVLLQILALNLAVAAAKLGYGLWSRSVAIQADALHSTFDGLANLVGLASMALAAAPPDDEHPYGHHRFELLGALGIAFLIAATAGAVAWEAIGRIGEESHARIEGGGLVLLGVVAMVSLSISRWEKRVSVELSSPVLAADSLHTLTDFFGTLVVFAAAVGIWMGAQWLDVAAALVIAVLIAHAAWTIARQGIAVLLETAAVPRSSVEAATLAVDGVRSCHKIRSRGTAGAVFVDLHIQVDPQESVETAHDRSGAVKAAIRRALPEVSDVLVHIEPDESSRPTATAPREDPP
ncbi:MAG: cation transporter [Deltaproteobacteria bacterium]|nr:cation transporter [Deltaproteobacteria bacterium]